MKKYKKGFSLVEMMLVLGVILSLTILKINDVKVETENVLASSMADQIKAIANATNDYINLNYNNITSLNTSSKKSQDIICDQVNTCEITLKTLKNNFLIPKGFNENSLMGKSYKIELKRKGTAPNYTIDGIVLTDYVGFKNGDKGILFANKILNNLGIDGGVSVGQEMKGMYGSWSAKKDEYKSIKEGMVGTLVGYNSNLYSVYLRRDGTLPMTGNLNLGNNDINSIKNLNASGTIVGNIVNANTGNIKTLNSDNIVNKIKFESSGTNILNGQTTINGTYFNINVNDTTFAKNVTVKGVASFTGNSNFNGQATFNNQTNFIGNIVAGKSNAEIGTVKINSTLNVKGKTTLESDLEIKKGSQTIILKDGNIVASGNIDTTGNMKSSNNIIGKYLKSDSISVVGGICNDIGIISKDKDGNLLNCVANKWKSVGGGGKPKIDFYRYPRHKRVTADLCVVLAVSANSGGGTCRAERSSDNGAVKQQWNLIGNWGGEDGQCDIACMNW